MYLIYLRLSFSLEEATLLTYSGFAINPRPMFIISELLLAINFISSLVNGLGISPQFFDKILDADTGCISVSLDMEDVSVSFLVYLCMHLAHKLFHIVYII